MPPVKNWLGQFASGASFTATASTLPATGQQWLHNLQFLLLCNPYIFRTPPKFIKNTARGFNCFARKKKHIAAKQLKKCCIFLGLLLQIAVQFARLQE